MNALVVCVTMILVNTSMIIEYANIAQFGTFVGWSRALESALDVRDCRVKWARHCLGCVPTAQVCSILIVGSGIHYSEP